MKWKRGLAGFLGHHKQREIFREQRECAVQCVSTSTYLVRTAMLGSARSGVGGEKKKKKNKQRLLVYLKCIRVMHGGLPNNNNERKTACQHLKAIGQFCINSTVLSWEGKGLMPLGMVLPLGQRDSELPSLRYQALKGKQSLFGVLESISVGWKQRKYFIISATTVSKKKNKSCDGFFVRAERHCSVE